MTRGFEMLGNIQSKLFGGRVIKTGIAVFLTVIMCNLFDIPTIFAVIAAIVTIEPTAHDSLRKGIVRFFASSIGSAYSMTLTSFFDHSPVSYALSAMLTIVSCQKLRLEAGTLVATITAVAMIPITETHYLEAFLTRLATTSVGITVSTFVNFFILPPNYTHFITKQMNSLFHEAADLLEQRAKELIGDSKGYRATVRNFDKLTKDLNKALTFIQYQQQDWKYHRHTKKEMRQFHRDQKKLTILQQITYHLGNLIHVKTAPTEWTTDEKEKLYAAFKSIISILRNYCRYIPFEHYQLIEQLDQQFWNIKEDLTYHKPKKYHHHFSPKSIILFEILSIHDMIEELESICHHELPQKSKDQIYNNKN